MTKTFIPRVPVAASESEDKTIPRVCFSESIEGCFDAVPVNIRNQMNAVGEQFVLYEIDTSDFPKNYFVLNKEILEKNLVPDANTTKECWLIKEVSLKGVLCQITDISREIFLDFSRMNASDVIITSESINREVFRLFDEAEIGWLKSLTAENAYKEIIHRADVNQVWDICDDLFYVLGSNFPEAARVRTSICFDGLAEPCRAKEFPEK